MALTPGAVAALRSQQFVPEHAKPILQVVGLTKIPGGERWKLELSDGTKSTSCMVATQFNDLIKANKLKLHSLVKVKEYVINEVAGRHILIILDMEVTDQTPSKIGNPVEFDAQAGAAAAAAPVKAPQYSPPPAYQAPPMQQQPAYAPQQYQPPQAYKAPAPAAAQQYTPPPVAKSFSGSGPVATYGGGGASNVHTISPRTMPIKSINPYQNKWVIRARVSSKSDVRSWDKGPTNQGKLFSVDLIDQEGSEIRATFFKDAVDLFYEQLQVGGVYTFADGKVKVANRNFTQITNDYEISFDKNAQIRGVEDAGDISRINVQPVPIASLAEKPAKTMVDVVAVVTDQGEPASFTSKQGKDLRKCEFGLVDDSGASIRLTMWGSKIDDLQAQLHSAGPSPIVAFKNLQLGDYNGKTLSGMMSTSTFVNPPDLPIVGRLRNWFDNGGASAGVQALSTSGGGGEGGSSRPMVGIEDRQTLQGIVDAGLGQNGGQDFCEVKATIAFIRPDQITYPACQTEKCNKKMNKSPSDDRWFCEKCGNSYDAPSHRYILPMQIGDASSTMWTTAFNKEAMTILGGRTGDEMEHLKATDSDLYKSILAQAQFQTGVFRLRVKEEAYQDKAPSIRTQAMDFKPINLVNECRELIKGIHALMARN